MEFHVFYLHEPRICYSISVCFISPAKIQMRWREKKDFLHNDSMASANVKRKIEQPKGMYTCEWLWAPIHLFNAAKLNVPKLAKLKNLLNLPRKFVLNVYFFSQRCSLLHFLSLRIFILKLDSFVDGSNAQWVSKNTDIWSFFRTLTLAFNRIQGKQNDNFIRLESRRDSIQLLAANGFQSPPNAYPIDK